MADRRDLVQYNTHASERNIAEKLSNCYKSPQPPSATLCPGPGGTALNWEQLYPPHPDAFQPMIWLNSSKILWEKIIKIKRSSLLWWENQIKISSGLGKLEVTYLEHQNLTIFKTINMSWSKSMWQLFQVIYKDYTIFLNQVFSFGPEW